MGATIDANMSLRIIRKILEIQDAHLQTKRKRGSDKNKKVKPPAIKDTICSTFGISAHTYYKIVSMYFTENRRVREVYSTAGDGSGYKPGNKTVHATRLPRTEELWLLVQNFVRQKRQNRERVTGKQVVDHLIESGRLIVPFEAAVGIDEAIVGRVYRK